MVFLKFVFDRQCNGGKHMFYGKDIVGSAFGVAPYMFINSDKTKVKGIFCSFFAPYEIAVRLSSLATARS